MDSGSEKKAGAHIEWVVGIIRAGSELEKFGDPYEFTCMLIKEGDRVHIKGAAGKFTLAIRRAISRALKEAGIDNAEWERANNAPRKVSRETS